MKKTLIATKSYMYDQREIHAEQEFEAEDAHANVLIRAGAARLKHSDEDEDGDSQQPMRRKTRTYKRRDMVAEGSDPK